MKTESKFNTQVLIGDTFEYFKTITYFKEYGASHFIIVKKNQPIQDILGDLMVGYRSYEEAKGHLPFARQLGKIKNNKIRAIDDELTAVQAFLN